MTTAEFSHMNDENLPIGQHQIQQPQHQQLSASSRVVPSHICTDYDEFTATCRQPFVGSAALAPAAEGTTSTMVHGSADRTEAEDAVEEEEGEEDDHDEDDDDDVGAEDDEVPTNEQSDLQDCIDALDGVIEQVPVSYLDHIIYDNYDHTSTTPTAVHGQHNSTNTSNHNTNITPPSSQQQQQPSAPNHSSIISCSNDNDSIDGLQLNGGSGDAAAGHLLFDQQLQQQQQESIATDQLYIYSALEQWIAHPEPIHPHIHDPIIYHHYTSSSSYMMLDSFPNDAATDAAAIGDDVKHFIGDGDGDHSIGPDAADQLHRYCQCVACFCVRDGG